jgi:hypothetical protein
MENKKTDIEHKKKMVEAISFLIFTEYAKKRLSDKKQYPKFDYNESEENIQKYKIMAHNYQADIDKYELKKERRLKKKREREFNQLLEREADIIFNKIGDEGQLPNHKEIWMNGFKEGAKWQK